MSVLFYVSCLTVGFQIGLLMVYNGFYYLPRDACSASTVLLS